MATKPKAENKPVYLIWGSEEYEVAQKARELVDRLCPPAEQTFGLEVVEGKADNNDAAIASLNKCLSALRTVGFFGGGKTVWLRDVNFFVPKRGGDAGEEDEAEDDDDPTDPGTVKERIAAITDEIKKGLPDGQRLVISATKILKNSALYKACEAAGEVIAFNPPEKAKDAERAGIEYVKNAFRDAGLQIRTELIEDFRDRAGDDTRQIRNEVEKLSLYLGGRKEVRAEDIRAIVSASREAVAWDLTEAVGKRNIPEALATLRHLISQKESPQLIIALLESRLRDLIVLRQCLDRRWIRFYRNGEWVNADWTAGPDADAWLRALPKDPRTMNKFRVGFMVEEASRYSFEELLRAHRLTTEAHERMVSSSVPNDILLEHLLISIMRGGSRAAA